MRVRSDAKGLPLVLDHQGAVPESIRTDPLRLRQILVNLVGNAIKFTETGSVRIAVRPDTERGEARLRFDVIDTGIGIAEEHLSMLFRPFFQLDGSARRRYAGTGLGLAISRRLAEMLGGDITVSSTLGRGSTFSVTIAIRPPDDRVESQLPPVETTRSVTASDDLPRLNCRILFAEDGPDNQRLIAFLLRKAGADVTVVEDGQKAVDELAHRGVDAFDLILMDMQMPVMDGYEATRRLKEMGFRGAIVALTAHAMPEDQRKCMAAGCDDYLSKPVDRRQLLQTAAKHVRAHSPRSPAVGP